MADSSLPDNLVGVIWHFVKPRCIWFIGVMVATLFFALLSVSVSYALKIVIDTLEQTTRENVWQSMSFPGGFLFFCYFGISVSLRLRNLFAKYFYPDLSRAITLGMHKVLQNRAYSYFQDQLNGGIASRLLELNKGVVLILELLVHSWFVVVLVLVYLFLLSFTSLWFTLIYFLWLLIYVPVILYFGVKTRNLAYGYAQSQTNLAGYLFDSINNMYFVKLFAQQTHEHSRIDDASSDTCLKDIALKKYLIWQRIVGDVFLLGLLVINIISLLYLYQKGLVSLGDFVFVIDTTSEISWYMWDYFGDRFLNMIEEYGKASQAVTILHAPFADSAKKGGNILEVKNGGITFNNLRYFHSGRGDLFNDFNLVINPGEKIGLVGFSGSGKTTLLHLLLRFYSPVEGEICIDGQDIGLVKTSSLRSNIAMIPQDSTLFHRSIMENIRYGNVECSDDDVIAAAKLAHAHDFIEQLPDSYHTMVGSRGVKISGGQRQRLAIARAFLKNAPIILLDEATSALDTVTERAVYSGLNALMKDRTAIVIAHRLSTIKAMDRIIVMENGVIVEQGSHESLLAAKGYYANMWSEQMSDDMLFSSREEQVDDGNLM